MTTLWSVNTGTELARINERISQNIALPLIYPSETTTKVISGALPPGLRLDGNTIKGSPFEVARSRRFEFVVRAVRNGVISDRTLTLIVDGADNPIWVTPEGLLPVNPNKLNFILDNTPVDFQLTAIDSDLPAGDSIEYYISDGDGELPPGIKLSKDGRLTGVVDPILALDLEGGDGGYDTDPYSKYPWDFGVSKSSSGIDSFYYDFTVYDYGISARVPRKLNRNYEFIVTATDNVSFTKRKFRIYVVGDDFLKADNNIMRAANGLFTVDGTFVRKPIWLTPGNLGVRRANNFVSLYLDVLDPNTLTGPIFYQLSQINNDSTPSVLPPGLALDNTNGEIVGYVPYQPAITKEYKFTVIAKRFNPGLGIVSVVGTYYEDVLVGKNSIKVYKLPTTLTDGIDDLYSLVGRSISIENREYEVISVDNTNIDYDIIVFKTLLETTYDAQPLVVERSATAQNYFFVNELTENSISFYKNRSLNISDSQKYKITDIYPYVEWEIRPAVGSSYVVLSSNSGDDIKTTLEASLGISGRNAYVTVTKNNSNQATLVKLLLPATAANRNLNLVQSLFTSNNVNSIRIAKLTTVSRLLLDTNIVTSFQTGRIFSLAVLADNSFEENYNVAELETYETAKTFTLSVLGEVESTISWVTGNDLGGIAAGRVSNLSIIASTTLVDSTLRYNLVAGKLPNGMRLTQYGELTGSPRQYVSSSGNGLTSFDNSTTTFDNESLTFDRKYTFTVIARDRFGFSASTKTFTITVTDYDKHKYSNVYMRPYLVRSQRVAYEQFINNSRVFVPSYLYRPGDAEFGLQRELKCLVFGGIETKHIENYVAAVAKNHTKKKYLLGDVKTAFAKNPGSNTVVYEVVYIELHDPLMPKSGTTQTTIRANSPNKITVDSLRYDTNTGLEPFKYKIDNTITIDSNAIKIDQTTNSLLYISNLQNMRKRIREVGADSGDFLPLWMRTQQSAKTQQTQYVPAIPICYTIPGKASTIVENIKNSGFDFKTINYEIDRYIVNTTLEDTGEKIILFANYKFNVG
jgi:hypothetical protein